jgi:hypothetical protein
MGTTQSTPCQYTHASSSLQQRTIALALTAVMSFSMSSVVASSPLVFCMAQITHTLAMTFFMDLLQVSEISWKSLKFRHSICLVRTFALASGALALHILAFHLLASWGIWQTIAIYRLGNVRFQAITCLPILSGCLAYRRPKTAENAVCSLI